MSKDCKFIMTFNFYGFAAALLHSILYRANLQQIKASEIWA